VRILSKTNKDIISRESKSLKLVSFLIFFSAQNEDVFEKIKEKYLKPEKSEFIKCLERLVKSGNTDYKKG
jgi:hypothetical protein